MAGIRFKFSLALLVQTKILAATKAATNNQPRQICRNPITVHFIVQVKLSSVAAETNYHNRHSGQCTRTEIQIQLQLFLLFGAQRLPPAPKF